MRCLCTEDINIDISRNYTHEHKIAHTDLALINFVLWQFMKLAKIGLMLQCMC